MRLLSCLSLSVSWSRQLSFRLFLFVCFGLWLLSSSPQPCPDLIAMPRPIYISRTMRSYRHVPISRPIPLCRHFPIPVVSLRELTAVFRYLSTVCRLI